MKNREFKIFAVDEDFTRRCVYAENEFRFVTSAIRDSDKIARRCKSVSREYDTKDRVLLTAWEHIGNDRTWLDPFSYTKIIGYELWAVNAKANFRSFYGLRCPFLGK